MENAHYLNFEYLEQLRRNDAKPIVNISRLIRPRLEFIYFFMFTGKPLLYTDQIYSQAYLDKIESITGKKNHLVDMRENAKFENYWGDVFAPNALEFNSKIWALKIGQQLNFPNTQMSRQIDDIQQIKQHINSWEYPNWLLKEHLGLSGRGIKKIDQQSIESLKLSGKKFVLMPYLNKLLDFSILFDWDPSSQQFIRTPYICFIDDRFQYAGGMLFKKVHDFYDYIAKRLNLDPLWIEQSFEKNYSKLEVEFKKQGLKSSFGIDAIFFKDKEAIDIYYFLECNYRKTMGHFLKALIGYYPNYSKLAVSVGDAGKKWLKDTSLKDIQTCLDPEGSRFHLYLGG